MFHIKMLVEWRPDLVVSVLAQVPSFARVAHLHFAAHLRHESNVRLAGHTWGTHTHIGSSNDVSGTGAAPSPAVVKGVIGVAPKQISVSCNVAAHDDVTNCQ